MKSSQAFRLICTICQVGLLASCVSVSDVDVSRVDPACSRGCTGNYSACVSAPAIGAPTALFYQCKEALKLCTRTCPSV